MVFSLQASSDLSSMTQPKQRKVFFGPHPPHYETKDRASNSVSIQLNFIYTAPAHNKELYIAR